MTGLLQRLIMTVSLQKGQTALFSQCFVTIFYTECAETEIHLKKFK